MPCQYGMLWSLYGLLANQQLMQGDLLSILTMGKASLLLPDWYRLCPVWMAEVTISANALCTLSCHKREWPLTRAFVRLLRMCSIDPLLEQREQDRFCVFPRCLLDLASYHKLPVLGTRYDSSLPAGCLLQKLSAVLQIPTSSMLPALKGLQPAGSLFHST